MGAADEYELITRAVHFTLSHAQEVGLQVVHELQTKAHTPLVNALRMLTMQSTITAIGCFSAFEAVLQQTRGWPRPFAEVNSLLRNRSMTELADRFLDYRSAINVLKHGAGPSYDRLLERQANLNFKVKARGEPFFEEGDVAEGMRLIDADHQFVRQCSNLITEIVEALRSDLANSWDQY